MVVLLFFKRHWIKFLVCILLGVGLMSLYNTSAGRWDLIGSYSNGCFVAGAVLVLLGLLSVVTNFGAFNLASFYFNRKRIEEGGRKENYAEYTNRKEEERASYRLGFLPYMIVGVVYIAVSLILYFCAIA